MPAEVPMFSVVKCPWPTQIAVDRERLSHTRSVARTVSSRRRISCQATELVNGHESFLALSNRGALSLLDASFKFAWKSVLSGFRRVCVWSKELLDEFSIISAVIGVSTGLTSAWRFGSQSGQASRGAPGPSVPGHVRFAPSPWMSVWSVQFRTKMTCRLP